MEYPRTSMDLMHFPASKFKAQDAREARNLDSAATEELGIPSLLLMENAARGLAGFALPLLGGGDCLVLAGKGNNGGDGMALARLLAPRARVALVQEPPVSADARLQLEILDAAGIPVERAPDPEGLDRLAEGCELIVDALCGTGLQSSPRGPMADWIRWANRRPEPVLAVDLPSGLQADTGEALDPTLRARWTVTFARPKRGMFRGEGPEHVGELKVASIGLPEDWVERWESVRT